jgi:hypothetical protein
MAVGIMGNKKVKLSFISLWTLFLAVLLSLGVLDVLIPSRAVLSDTSLLPAYPCISYTEEEESVTDSFGNTTRQIRKVQVISRAQQPIVEPEGKVIYLTFDDGPGPYTRELLDVLEKYGVKATFFVVKNKYSDILTDIARQGHAI